MCLHHILHSKPFAILVFTFRVMTGSSVLFYHLFISCGVAGRVCQRSVLTLNQHPEFHLCRDFYMTSFKLNVKDERCVHVCSVCLDAEDPTLTDN